MKTIAHTKGKDSTHATPRKQLWDNWHVIFLHVFLLNFVNVFYMLRTTLPIVYLEKYNVYV